jgi:hypothetical protein
VCEGPSVACNPRVSSNRRPSNCIWYQGPQQTEHERTTSGRDVLKRRLATQRLGMLIEHTTLMAGCMMPVKWFYRPREFDVRKEHFDAKWSHYHPSYSIVRRTFYQVAPRGGVYLSLHMSLLMVPLGLKQQPSPSPQASSLPPDSTLFISSYL